MDFDRAEPKYYRTNFPYASSGQQNAAFSYIVLCLTYIRGLILELSRSFPIGLQCVIVAFLGHTNWLVDKILLNIGKINSAFLRISHSTFFETLTLLNVLTTDISEFCTKRY